jgi:hypothetical protein
MFREVLFSTDARALRAAPGGPILGKGFGRKGKADAEEPPEPATK